MKVKLTFLLVFMVSLAIGQAPKLINYQGIVRGVDGAPTLNQAISMRFQILKGTATGTVVYTELQSLTTNSLGLIQTQIGLSANLGTVNWTEGPFFLEVSTDISGGTNLVLVGTQQILGVPFSFLASNVPASYSPTTNILTVGENTFTLSAPPTGTLTGTGIASVTSSGSNSFQIAVPSPSYTNLGPVQITGSYPNYTLSSASPTLTGTGNASVSNPATNSFVVNVPFMQITTSSTAGVSGISGSGTNSVNINIPPATTTLNGTGAISIGPSNVGSSFFITVPPTNVALTQTGTASGISSSGTNSFNINVPVTTISAAGLATVSSSGSSFNIGVAPFAYVPSTGVLSSGVNNVVVAPQLSFNNGTLTSGPSSNSVSLASLAPWRQGVSTVTLANITDRVGIGTAAPTENLQVEGTTNSSISIVSSSSGNSDLGFGTSVNHGLGRLRYDNSTGTLSFWTAGSLQSTFNNQGQMVIGTASSYSTTTGLTVGRAGAFSNQLMITGGDANNLYGGMLTLGENLNPSSGVTLKLDALNNRLIMTNDINGSIPAIAFGGYTGAPNGVVVGSGYASSVFPPAEGMLVQGNLGVGTFSPGTRLEVGGDISIPNGNKIQFGTNLSGSGIGEWIQNSGSGLQFHTSSLPRMNITNTGFVGIGTTNPSSQLHVIGNTLLQGNTTISGTSQSLGNLTVGASSTATANIRVYGAVRMGTEVGTAQAPAYPFNSGGMVMRRIYSTITTSNSAVAITDFVRFERDGTNGGFIVTRTGGNGLETCQCSGVTSTGLTLNKVFNNLILGSTQVYLDTENVVYLRCMFGDPYGGQNMTEISISRWPSDYFWMGHLISTFNQ